MIMVRTFIGGRPALENSMNGKAMIYADDRDLSNVHRAHGARPFASVDCAAACLHSAGESAGPDANAAFGWKCR
jgi:hypothetical protein